MIVCDGGARHKNHVRRAPEQPGGAAAGEAPLYLWYGSPRRMVIAR